MILDIYIYIDIIDLSQSNPITHVIYVNKKHINNHKYSTMQYTVMPALK